MDDSSREAKKRWKAAHREDARARFPLSHEDLDALFRAVDERLETAACDHTLAFTRAWLEFAGLDVERVCAWLRSTGGYCDCEVAANSREHWEQNR